MIDILYRRPIVLALAAFALYACNAGISLNPKSLFEGYVYVGSYSGEAARGDFLQKDNEPTVPEVGVSYIYKPQMLGDFERAGKTLFAERLRRQGFHIDSAPGVRGGAFIAFDPGGAEFIIDFRKGTCVGSLRGVQNDAGSEEYTLKLDRSCR